MANQENKKIEEKAFKDEILSPEEDAEISKALSEVEEKTKEDETENE